MSAILIVDDDSEIRQLVANVVRAAGFQAICATNGKEAVSVLDGSSDGIDMIVTDLTMPIMDGHQLIRLVRRLHPGIRIICMSGYSDGVPPGVVFLHKPFTASMLSRAIRGFTGV
jgi:two-component system, cell cycle sensor histidine kinase and response regulator CckA